MLFLHWSQMYRILNWWRIPRNRYCKSIYWHSFTYSNEECFKIWCIKSRKRIVSIAYIKSKCRSHEFWWSKLISLRFEIKNPKTNKEKDNKVSDKKLAVSITTNKKLYNSITTSILHFIILISDSQWSSNSCNLSYWSNIYHEAYI